MIYPHLLNYVGVHCYQKNKQTERFLAPPYVNSVNVVFRVINLSVVREQWPSALVCVFVRCARPFDR